VHIKKKGWKKPRDILPAFVSRGVPVGDSCRPHPYLPQEYIGVPLLIIPLCNIDDELAGILNMLSDNGVGDKK